MVEALTADGRDRSIDYKLSGFCVPKGSWDGKVPAPHRSCVSATPLLLHLANHPQRTTELPSARPLHQVLDEIAPVGDEIVLPKGSSSVW